MYCSIKLFIKMVMTFEIVLTEIEIKKNLFFVIKNQNFY